MRIPGMAISVPILMPISDPNYRRNIDRSQFGLLIDIIGIRKIQITVLQDGHKDYKYFYISGSPSILRTYASCGVCFVYRAGVLKTRVF